MPRRRYSERIAKTAKEPFGLRAHTVRPYNVSSSNKRYNKELSL